MTSNRSFDSSETAEAFRSNSFRFDVWMTMADLYEIWLALDMTDGERNLVTELGHRVEETIRRFQDAGQARSGSMFRRARHIGCLGNEAILLRPTAREALRMFLEENWRVLSDNLSGPTADFCL